MFESRTPPAAIARQLRQEAGFGCAVCGCPIVEFHHIIEWSEDKHFNPDHMVALCPTHHAEFGKLPKKRSYAAKANPINIKNGRIRGFLGGNKTQKALKVGGMRLLNCRSAVNFSGISIFSYRLEAEEYLLSALLPDKKFWPEVEISDNEMSAQIENFWDIEFKTNWVKFRRKKGEVFLSIDFRGDDVHIKGKLNILGQTYEFGNEKNQFGGISIVGGEMANSAVGISLGPPGKLIRPNFAMRAPTPFWA